MGKFSNYVESLKSQADSLRTALTTKSGEDCSNYSIGTCASVVNGLETTTQTDDGYVRPSWYPNIETILNNAPDITVNGTTYYPAYAVLFLGYSQEDYFYKTGTSSTSAVNYGNFTGCDAYIFSDVVNNNIANADDTTLQVGTTITHVWDQSKDITNAESIFPVRWSVAYTTSKTTPISVCLFNNADAHEIVVGECTLGSYFLTNTYTTSGTLNDSSYKNKCLEYIKILQKCKTKSLSVFQHFPSPNQHLVEVDIGYIEELTPATSQAFCYFFAGCPCLKKVNLNSLKVINSTNSNVPSFRQDYALKELLLPAITDITGANMYFISDMPSLKTVSFGSNLQHFEITYGTISQRSFLNSCGALEVVDLSSMPITNLPNLLNVGYSVKSLILPSNLQAFAGNLVLNGGGYNLKYVKIPNTVTSFGSVGSGFFPYTPYIELFNDFDISGANFTGSSTKSVQWFKDLCGWLKDKTGETANTMTIGSANLAIANSIYLTFDSEDKRNITFDGVTSSTAGAVTVTDYITNQLNWTLS